MPQRVEPCSHDGRSQHISPLRIVSQNDPLVLSLSEDPPDAVQHRLPLLDSRDISELRGRSSAA